jgi:drug/metabolite transporter (DMT)-like permease
MSLLAPDSPGLPSRALHGILCVEIGTLFFVAQDAMMKSMLALYPIWTLIFARSVMSVLVLLPLVVVLGGPHRLLTPLWPLHLARAALFTTGFTLFYAAFPFMGLAEVTTIFFAAPLITALMAALWLKETIGPHRLGALVVGFAGVLIAMNPTGDAFTWIAILPLLCAVTYAASQIIARRIGDRESTLTVGLYTLGFSGLMILPMGWGFWAWAAICCCRAPTRWPMPASWRRSTILTCRSPRLSPTCSGTRCRASTRFSAWR